VKTVRSEDSSTTNGRSVNGYSSLLSSITEALGSLNRLTRMPSTMVPEIQLVKEDTSGKYSIPKLVCSDLFDYVMSLILILNSVIAGLRVDWTASNLGEADHDGFIWADRLFCIVFLTELLMRLYTFKMRFYTMIGWQWAYFDTCVVGIQVLEEIFYIFMSQDKMNIGFLKILKMGRLLRMVRMVRLLPELKSLVLLIMASMSSFIWTCVLLLLLVYMLAIYMTIMAVDVLSEKVNEPSTPNSEEVQRMWGSIGSSVLSIYWSITGGQDWAVVIGPLIEETGNQVHNVVFCMFIAFATMVLMNLVTGVFVEGAARLTKEDRDKELSRMAHKIFRLVDDDCSEDISRREFEHHLEMGNIDRYLDGVGLNRFEARVLFDLLDSDGSETISVNEFVDGCLKLRGLPRAADLSQMLLESRKQWDSSKEWFSTMSSLLETTRRDLQMVRAAQGKEFVGSVHEV